NGNRRLWITRSTSDHRPAPACPAQLCFTVYGSRGGPEADRSYGPQPASFEGDLAFRPSRYHSTQTSSSSSPTPRAPKMTPGNCPETWRSSLATHFLSRPLISAPFPANALRNSSSQSIAGYPTSP